jgi:hypothetical protein
MSLTVKKRRMPRWLLWVATPVLICFLCIGLNWLYEVFELKELSGLVDEASLPGTVVAKDGRNDWPFGTSNGAFIRAHWIIISYQPKELRKYAQQVEERGQRRYGTFRLFLKDLGPLDDENWTNEVLYLEGDPRLFLLRLERVREQYQWEIPD